MSDEPKLVIGRLENLDHDRGVVVPLGPVREESHDAVTLKYQRRLAALIAAAHLYKELHTVESIERLKRAAEGL